MADNEEVGEKTFPDASITQIKVDQIRTIPGTALLRTMSGQQTRIMMTAPVQSTHSAAVICSTTPQTSVGIATPAPSPHHIQSAPKSVPRIGSVPLQTVPSASYHVPRGAAAVANIAAPRSSVATPIRAPSNLQAINVTQQHSISTSVGRAVVGVTAGYVNVPTSLSAQVSNLVPRQQAKLPSTQAVNSRLAAASSHGRSSEARPVLLQATTTHKQVSLTQQVTDKVMGGGGGAVIKSLSSGGGSASRIVPSMVPLGQSAVLVGATTPKTATGQRVMPQQAPTPPTAIHHQQSTIISSTILARPVMLGGSGTVVRSSISQPSKLYQSSEQQTVSQPIFIQQKPQIVSGSVYGVQPQSGGPSSTGSLVTSVGSVSSASVAMVQQASSSSQTTTHQIHLTPVQPAPTPISAPSPVFPINGTPAPLTALPFSTQQPSPAPAPAPNPTPVSVYLDQRPPVTSPQSSAPSHQGVVSATGPSIRFNPVMVVDTNRSTPTVVPHSTFSTSTPTAEAQMCSDFTSYTNNLSGVVLGPQQTVATQKQNLSPRPSILRKRDPDGWCAVKVQKNLLPMLSSLSVSTGSVGGSGTGNEEECSAQAGSGGSSTLSAASSPGEDSTPLLSLVPPPTPLHHHQEMSPRKKPRKQQLPHDQLCEPSSWMEFISDDHPKPKAEFDEQEKRKRMSLLKSYKHVWKSTNNHFMRYSDIKTKEEKKATLSELANQKNALHKINGWKIYHLISQVEDMVNSESEYFELFSNLLNVLEEGQPRIKMHDLDKKNDEMMNRINERIKANAQRCKVVNDHMQEAKSQIMKLFNHKSYVADLINRSANKRSLKKRERQ